MDVTLQTIILQLPSSDMQFLKELAKRMGWVAGKVKSNSKMSVLDKAILNVKEGECQELRYIGGYDDLSGSLDMSIKCLVKK